MQFAVEHGLLVDEQGTTFTVQDALRNGLAYADLPAYGNALLDEQETATVLKEQLGKPFPVSQTPIPTSTVQKTAK